MTRLFVFIWCIPNAISDELTSLYLLLDVISSVDVVAVFFVHLFELSIWNICLTQRHYKPCSSEFSWFDAVLSCSCFCCCGSWGTAARLLRLVTLSAVTPSVIYCFSKCVTLWHQRKHCFIPYYRLLLWRHRFLSLDYLDAHIRQKCDTVVWSQSFTFVCLFVQIIHSLKTRIWKCVWVCWAL